MEIAFTDLSNYIMSQVQILKQFLHGITIPMKVLMKLDLVVTIERIRE